MRPDEPPIQEGFDNLQGSSAIMEVRGVIRRRDDLDDFGHAPHTSDTAKINPPRLRVNSGPNIWAVFEPRAPPVAMSSRQDTT